MVCRGGMCHRAADTAPDHTQRCARTIVPAHPQVLESGILQRISPEERKRQEVREAWEHSRVTKGVGHTWLCQGQLQVELGSAQLMGLLLPAAVGLGTAGRAHLHESVGKQQLPWEGKTSSCYGFLMTECPEAHWDYWYWPGHA